MAVVGDAYIVVRAITSGFEADVRKAARGINLERDGKSVGESFSKGFGQGASGSLGDALGSFGKQAEAARGQFQSLIRTSYTLGPALSVLVSSVGTLGGGFVALAGTVAGAIPSLVVLPGIFTAIGLSAITAFAAFSGVSKAVSAGLAASKKATQDNTASKIAAARRIEDINKRIAGLEEDGLRLDRDRLAALSDAEAEKTKAIEDAAANEEEAYTKLTLVKEKNTESMIEANNRLKDAQLELTKALEAGREEIQQIGFDAEDAALSEKRASITLEKARETLQRTQDLPPNSRARREAQLAFAEAELGLRRAKDKNKDLQKEQEKLAGDPKNTAGYIDALKRQEEAQVNVAQTARDALRSQQEAEANITAVKLANTQKILDAEKNIAEVKQRYQDREADLIARIQDAYDDLARAMEDQAAANKGGAAGIDAYGQALNNLSPAAQAFVKYLIGTFIPALKQLRDAVAETLLPAVQEGLEKLRTQLFPALKPLMAELGTSLGNAFNSVIDAIVDPKNIADLGKVFAQAGYVVEGLGKTIGNVYDSILSILVGADPLIRKFTDFLQKKTGQFVDFLDAKQASGELEKFFNKTGDIAAKWGEVLGNIFSGTFNTVKAIFAPGGAGDYILNWFTESTARFEKFTASAKGQNYLAQYFKDVAVNSRAVLGALGAFTKEILKAGADPNIKVFWDTLKGAAPAFGQLLKQSNAAAPALAKLVVSFINFANVTLSSGAIQGFFDILRGGLDFITKIMANPAIQDLFNFAAKAFAAFSAFGLIGDALAFGGKVFAGSLMSIGNAVSFLLNPIEKLVMGYLKLGPLIEPIAAAFGTSVTGFLTFAAAAAAVVAVFVLLYTQSETFRKAIGDLVSAVGGALKDAFKTINDAIKSVAPNIDGIMGVFRILGDFLGKFVVPIFKVVLVQAIKFAAESIATFIKVIAGVSNAFGGIAGAVRGAFTIVINVVKGAINALISLWNNSLGKLKITLPKIGPFGGGTIGFPTIPQLAAGGTVYPSAGGTIARVAEAGRAERIEPLDANGLSQRDKAMIQLLAGSSNGKDMTINVYPSPGMNESELASMVSRQIAFQLRRGGA